MLSCTLWSINSKGEGFYAAGIFGNDFSRMQHPALFCNIPAAPIISFFWCRKWGKKKELRNFFIIKWGTVQSCSINPLWEVSDDFLNFRLPNLRKILYCSSVLPSLSLRHPAHYINLKKVLWQLVMVVLNKIKSGVVWRTRHSLWQWEAVCGDPVHCCWVLGWFSGNAHIHPHQHLQTVPTIKHKIF